MSDATITPLVPRNAVPGPARDCGSARIIELPLPPAGRLIRPLGTATSPRAGDVDPFAHLHVFDPGPLARALMVMAGADRDRATAGRALHPRHAYESDDHAE